MCKCKGCRSCIQCGSGAPLPATPLRPKLYIDSNTGDIYYHDGNDWSLKTSSMSLGQETIIISVPNIVGGDEITLSHTYDEIASDLNSEKIWMTHANGPNINPNSDPMTATLIDNGTDPATVKFSSPLGEPGRPCQIRGWYQINK